MSHLLFIRSVSLMELPWGAQITPVPIQYIADRMHTCRPHGARSNPACHPPTNLFQQTTAKVTTSHGHCFLTESNSGHQALTATVYIQRMHASLFTSNHDNGGRKSLKKWFTTQFLHSWSHKKPSVVSSDIKIILEEWKKQTNKQTK
jgi:hypothetical protein